MKQEDLERIMKVLIDNSVWDQKVENVNALLQASGYFWSEGETRELAGRIVSVVLRGH